jgi:hypothetical protein
VLCLAAVARAAALVALSDALDRDPDGYRALADALVNQGVLGESRRNAEADRPSADRLSADRTTARADALPRPSAFRPPLYPLLLVPCVAWGQHVGCCIGLLQLSCGLATVWFAWRLARRWQLSLPSRAVAAALVAIDPILLFQTSQVMTEILAALLAAAALLAVTRAGQDRRARSAALAGSLAAVAVLCRPTFLIWLVLVGPALALGGGWPSAETPPGGRSWFARLRLCSADLGPFAAYCAAAALVLSPWVVRNAIVFGRPIVTTTHGGYTLLLGNNHLYYEHLRRRPWHEAWQPEQLQAELRAAESADGATDELARDRVAYRLAGEAIAREPGMFLVACLMRCTRLWGVLPLRVSEDESPSRCLARWMVAGGYAFELVLAGVGLCRIGRQALRPPWLWGLLLAGSFTAVHAFYWTDLRMRAPLVPVVALAAGVAVNGPRRN